MASNTRIAQIGAGGTIGLSLCAFHVVHLSSSSNLTVLDPRPGFRDILIAYLTSVLPPSHHEQIPLIKTANSVANAVVDAEIVYEAGPESLDWKSDLWAEVESHAPPNCLLWSATTGIPASAQNTRMKDKSRLIVVHPFNPPHVLPLIELVPSPLTSNDVVQRTLAWWRDHGRDPIVLKKEVPGFVAGRLAWALLREAISLVDRGIVSVEEVDRAIEGSMGVRWAYQGPFKSFHAGGGEKGLEGLMQNVGGTVQKVWDDLGDVKFGDGWEEKVFGQCKEKYGIVGQEWLAARDRANQLVLNAVKEDPL